MKPTVICHMMSSVDGRLHPERYTRPYYNVGDAFYLDSYFRMGSRLKAQAILIGRRTYQGHFSPKTYSHTGGTPARDFSPFKGNCPSGQYSIVLDAKGKILHETSSPWGSSTLAILGEGVTEEYLEHLRALGVSYLFAGKDGHDMDKALRTLCAEFGINRLLLEGGATVNGLFLHAGLIDELSLAIYPGIDGLKGVPAIFEYEGKEGEQPAVGQQLELLSATMEEGGVVWLRYRFHKPDGIQHTLP